MVLSVGVRRTEPAEGEGARLGHIAGGGTAPRHEELQGRDQRPKPAALAVERHAGPRPLQNVDVEMILQIFPGTPAARKSAAGPMPDKRRSCGELKAPAAITTSRSARTLWRLRRRRYSTPMARSCSMTMPVASAPVKIVRFSRLAAGCK